MVKLSVLNIYVNDFTVLLSDGNSALCVCVWPYQEIQCRAVCSFFPCNRLTYTQNTPLNNIHIYSPSLPVSNHPLHTHTHLASWPAVQTTNPLCVATGMQRRVCLSTCNKKLGVCVYVNKLKGYLGIFSPSLFHNDSSMSLCTLLLFCNLCSSSTKAPEV